MALTEITIKNTKATGKPFKLYDGNGLYLHFSKAINTKKGLGLSTDDMGHDHPPK